MRLTAIAVLLILLIAVVYIATTGRYSMKVIRYSTLYKDGEYVSFPNMIWISEYHLSLFFRHAKDRQKEFGGTTHIDATAKDVFVISLDGGQTFSPGLRTVFDDDMSEQDPCVTVLADGRIIMTTFRWQIVEAEKGAEIWGEELFGRYGRKTQSGQDAFNIGFSCSISDDHGITWTHYPVIEPAGYVLGSAVRGNIVEMPDGSLLMPFYGCKTIGALASGGLVRSTDRGETWSFFSETACDPDINFLEPSLYLTESGKLVSLFRTQSDWMLPGVKFDDTYMNQHISESVDGGRTFGEPVEIPEVLGSNPFSVTRLRDGRIFISYGYRKEPYGIRAKICNSELTNIAEAPELIVRDGAPNADLGYPHAAQLPNGDVLLVYYITDDDGIRIIEGCYIKV
jgi:hypothetical protein